MQLLIVDDEIHIVDRLLDTVDWKSAGIDQVHKAHSGPEALAVLERFSADIVLTDIRMPGMDGLRLIAEIRRRWPKTKCILLSGYSEFQYAKEAILHGTEDYLLKPVKDEDLLETVRRVTEKVQAEWEEVVSRQRLAHTLRENMPLLRANLLNDLLQGRSVPEDALRGKLDKLGLPGSAADTFELLMVRMEEFPADDAESLSLMEYAVGNIAGELFGERYDIWQAKDAHDYLVFVMLAKSASAAASEGLGFDRTATALQSAVKSYLKGKISLLSSGPGRFPQDLRGLYERSVSSLRRRFGGAEELLLRLGDERETTAAVPSLSRLYEPPALIHLLEAARWDEIREKLSAAFEELERRAADCAEFLPEVYFAVASAYSYIAHKNGRLLGDLLGEDSGRMPGAVPFRSARELRQWAFRALEKIREDMEKETMHSRVSLIHEIRAFIERNLSRDVSLQAISGHVYLHPVYVSTIYKHETGENLSDYVHRIRMEKAVSTLKETTVKIYEVAAGLGYQRPHSFIHAFKKSFGITPQEFRDQYANKGSAGYENHENGTVHGAAEMAVSEGGNG